MRLTELVVSHYKSLGDVELKDIQPVTVLVGCNGVGKSNVADVLRFLRDAVNQGLDHAVSTRGGIGLIRQYSPKKPYQITLTFRFRDEKSPENEIFYQLSITSLREGEFRVEREHAEWFDSLISLDKLIEISSNDENSDPTTQTLRFERTSEGKVFLTADKGLVKLRWSDTLPSDTLALGNSFLTDEAFAAGTFGGTELKKFIENTRFSSIFPNTLRQPAHPDTDPILKENGANWASILRTLRKTAKGKQALEEIKEMMQVVMPQLEDISTQAVGGFIHPRFKVREANGKQHYFDPSQISDGTLRILGILLALYQSPHPSLMVIEEPEQTVNPALLAVLADAFRESSERTQLLITSHSPHLVDLFEPENIRVVTMQDGETRLGPIRASQREAIKEHLLSLEQIMSAEGLQPEAG